MGSSPLPGASYGATFGTLAFFLVATITFGIVYGRKMDVGKYLSARNSQGAMSLTLSFFASGAGAWVLFTVPEAAVLGGPIAVVGYAIATIVPLLIFACVAPRLRRLLPFGITFFEFVQLRYGTLVNIYVTLIAAFYMFLYLAAEFTSVGDCVALLSNSTLTPTEKTNLPPIIGTSLVTLLYTTIGGLPVSLLTDRLQGFGVLIFSVLVFIAAIGYALFPTYVDVEAANAASANWQTVTSYGIGGTAANSFKMAVTLILAVTSANLMHTGFQQRIWAGLDNPAVVQGLWGASIMTLPFMLIFGLFGMIAYGQFGPAGLLSPYVAFLSAFKIIQLMPTGWQIAAIILAVMMVASSADTIQSGLQGLFTPMVESMLTCRAPGQSAAQEGGGVKTCNVLAVGISLALTVVINIVAIVLATQGLSVLSLFVLADLLCATCCVPVIMGLSNKVHPVAALVGCLTGLMCALIIYGVGLPCDSLDAAGLPLCDHVPEAGNFFELMKPGGLYSTTSLVAFIVTPVASGLVTALVALPLHLICGYTFKGYPDQPQQVKEATLTGVSMTAVSAP